LTQVEIRVKLTVRRFDIQLAGADDSPINTAKAGQRYMKPVRA
jgi:hypothetical protein